MSRRPSGRDDQGPHPTRPGTAETAVLDALERLLVDRSIHALAVAHILEEAGLSRASFYKYFASKHDVLIGLLRRISATVPLRPPAREDPGVRVVLRDAMGVWAEHTPVIRAAVESVHVVPEVGREWAAMQEHLVRVLAPRISAERWARRVVGGPSPELLATLLIHGVERSFFVAAGGLDERLPDAASTFDALDGLIAAAVGGPGPSVPNPLERAVPR